jgi:hypothetical protein
MTGFNSFWPQSPALFADTAPELILSLQSLQIQVENPTELVGPTGNIRSQGKFHPVIR